MSLCGRDKSDNLATVSCERKSGAEVVTKLVQSHLPSAVGPSLVAPKCDIASCGGQSTLLYFSVLTSSRYLSHLTTVLGINENVSVPGSSLVHIRHSLVDLVHLPFLDPRLDVIVGGELEHLWDRSCW